MARDSLYLYLRCGSGIDVNGGSHNKKHHEVPPKKYLRGPYPWWRCGINVKGEPRKKKMTWGPLLNQARPRRSLARSGKVCFFKVDEDKGPFRRTLAWWFLVGVFFERGSYWNLETSFKRKGSPNWRLPSCDLVKDTWHPYQKKKKMEMGQRDSS